MGHIVEPQKMWGHAAVRLNHYIVVIGGKGEMRSVIKRETLINNEVWMYNLYTEQWRMCDMLQGSKASPASIIDGACIVAVVTEAYVFGGRNRVSSGQGVQGTISVGDLWQMTITPEGCLNWGKIKTKKPKAPSSRCFHTGWEYAGNLWIFGGMAKTEQLPAQYLNDHGDFVTGYNNQLLCFSPPNLEWTNPKQYGSVPSPRAGHSTTIIKDTVWLYGGCINRSVYNGLYKLNMHSLTWTYVHSSGTHPEHRVLCTLCAISDKQLVLHGGKKLRGDVLHDTLILDISSQIWRQHITSVKDHPRCGHTSSPGINCDLVIIGGRHGATDPEIPNSSTFHVTLEPVAKSLQQLTLQIIYRHHHMLPWKSLPKVMIAQLGLAWEEGDKEVKDKASLGSMEKQKKSTKRSQVKSIPSYMRSTEASQRRAQGGTKVTCSKATRR